jgi:ribosome-associated translation inhibitor RaiA
VTVDFVEFEYEYYSEIDQMNAELSAEAELRLRALAEGHSDIIGARVAMEELTGSETPHLYEATITIYKRPENVVAVEKADAPETALKAALSAVEREVREYREKLRERWRQP